jgi:hypothetical protein
MREEKMEEQRLKQEERVRKAMERARAEPKYPLSIRNKCIYLLEASESSITTNQTNIVGKLNL